MNQELRTIEIPHRQLFFVVEPVQKHLGLQSVLVIPQSECTIGSGKDCQMRLNTPGVLERHCVIVSTGSALILREWEGIVWLNGRVVKESTNLLPTDLIAIGPAEFRLRLANNSDLESFAPGGGDRSGHSASNLNDKSNTSASLELIDKLRMLIEQQTDVAAVSDGRRIFTESGRAGVPSPSILSHISDEQNEQFLSKPSLPNEADSLSEREKAFQVEMARKENELAIHAAMLKDAQRRWDATRKVSVASGPKKVSDDQLATKQEQECDDLKKQLHRKLQIVQQKEAMLERKAKHLAAERVRLKKLAFQLENQAKHLGQSKATGLPKTDR